MKTTNSDQQQKILKKAARLLSKYIKEKVSSNTCFFSSESEGELGDEYDTCDNEKCVEEMRTKVKDLFKELTDIESIPSHDRYEGCRDRVERCAICLRPFNDTMTWVRDEFIYYKILKTKRELTCSHHVFDIMAIFESLPATDFRDVEDVETVVKFAKFVIKKLSQKKKRN